MEEIINPAGEQFEMQASPRGLAVNPLFADDGHRSTAVKSNAANKLKIIRKRKTRHSGNDTSNVYDHLNFEEATEPLKPVQGSNRALLAQLGIITIVGLISLTTLLLTLLMLSGKISPLNEAGNLESAMSELKSALDRANNELAELNSTQNKNNLESAMNELKATLDRANNELAELNSTQNKGKVIYHQTMTPIWLKAHARLYGNPSFTPEQLTFNASSVYRAALLKVTLIPANVFQISTNLTVKVTVAMDVNIGRSRDSDILYGMSDGISFVGFETVDDETYTRNSLPCFGREGSSGDSITGLTEFNDLTRKPSYSLYPGQFFFTLKLDAHENWGSCYTAQRGGFVNTATYNKRLLLSKGLTLEVYKDHRGEKVGIKFMEVTVIDDL